MNILVVKGKNPLFVGKAKDHTIQVYTLPCPRLSPSLPAFQNLLGLKLKWIELIKYEAGEHDMIQISNCLWKPLIISDKTPNTTPRVA